MSEAFLIRDEVRPDIVAIRHVNESAFETTAEARLVDVLRDQVSFLISLVATIDDFVVGHILFSPVTLEGHPQLKLAGLAPMAVLPSHQRQGIGTALVTAGLER
ncbi:MAG: N-acetyltransferase, partial [Planctomycetaceae bacterium]